MTARVTAFLEQRLFTEGERRRCDRRAARAEGYARATYDLCLAELQRRPLDQETQLPTALGAAIEVLGQAQAARGARTAAVVMASPSSGTSRSRGSIRANPAHSG